MIYEFGSSITPVTGMRSRIRSRRDILLVVAAGAGTVEKMVWLLNSREVNKISESEMR